MPRIPGKALTGQMLKNRAREWDIPGRSKMTADELREAVHQYEEEQRAERRAKQRDARLTSEAQARGENIVSVSAYDKSVIAGNRGNDPEAIDNDTRERNYREQRTQVHPGNYDAPLTRRQKRRLRKKARKNGES